MNEPSWRRSAGYALDVFLVDSWIIRLLFSIDDAPQKKEKDGEKFLLDKESNFAAHDFIAIHRKKPIFLFPIENVENLVRSSKEERSLRIRRLRARTDFWVFIRKSG